MPIDQDLRDIVALMGRPAAHTRLQVFALVYSTQTELAQRFGLSPDFVTYAIRQAVSGSRYSRVRTLRLLWQFSRAPSMERAVAVRLLGDLSQGGNVAWGSLYVLEFLDLTGLWRSVQRLEVNVAIRQGARSVTRRYDIVLEGGYRFELKNWWQIDPGTWGRSHARVQIRRDLQVDPLTNTFWVFSHGLPVSGQEAFYEWFTENVERVVTRFEAAESGSEAISTVRRNWDALRSDPEKLRARVLYLDPQEIRGLRGEDEPLSMVERTLIDQGILPPR